MRYQVAYSSGFRSRRTSVVWIQVVMSCLLLDPSPTPKQPAPGLVDEHPEPR